MFAFFFGGGGRGWAYLDFDDCDLFSRSHQHIEMPNLTRIVFYLIDFN